MRTLRAALVALLLGAACGGSGTAPASATPTAPDLQSAPHTIPPAKTSDAGGYGY